MLDALRESTPGEQPLVHGEDPESLCRLPPPPPLTKWSLTSKYTHVLMHMQTPPWIHCITCIFVCYYAHWCNDYAFTHVHTYTHTDTCTIQFLPTLSFYSSYFWILIFPSISLSPRRPTCISSSTHFVLLGGLHGASCFMWPFSPSVLEISGIWSLWITPSTPSVCLCS